MKECLLADRGIVIVAGADAEDFLNRLFTNNMRDMRPGEGRYAALLSPQGKILFDFLVLRRDEAFWIDVARAQSSDLAKRLNLFKLRAKVTIEPSDDLLVAASWDGALMEAPGAAFRDPRHNDLGYRIVAAADRLAAFDHDASVFDRHRIDLGIPEGGIDFVYGDTFVHDANLDLLHGVDFGKGCYVGQEVVSRVHHRASARKRIAKLAFYGEAPQVGTEIVAGALNIGTVTSALEHEGLATVRTDRLAEAQSMNLPLLAGATLVGVQLPGESQVVRPNYAEDVF